MSRLIIVIKKTLSPKLPLSITTMGLFVSRIVSVIFRSLYLIPGKEEN